MKLIVYSSLMVIILTGCSASGKKYVKGSNHIPPNLAKLTIYREHAEPTAYPVTIKIDNKEVVSLKQKGFSTIYISAGQRTILADWPAFAGQPDQNLVLNAKINNEYFVTLVGRYRAVTDNKYLDNKHPLPGEEQVSMRLSGGSSLVIRNNMATVSGMATINGAALALVSNKVAQAHLIQCCYEQKPLQKHY